MDLATTMSVVQTLLVAFQCFGQLKEVCSLFGYESELESLQNTLHTIKAVLTDAEAKEGALSEQGKEFIEALKDALYDADDVFDEFFTLAEQRKLIGTNRKVSDRVKIFLSRFQFVTSNICRKVNRVKKKLDAIATRSKQFGFKVDHQPIKYRREESCSYVYADDIIGRDVDVEKIIGRLLDTDVQENVTCLTIVGMGGLGKTAVAQLVFNDERVANEFPIRLWTCVSDHDQDHFDIEAILRKILASAMQGDQVNPITMDGVQRKLQEHLKGNRYLLVLDDVWNENRESWYKLERFLMGDQIGSHIVVTTRSRETARIIGNDHTYELQGLSIEDSWSLFEKAAFDQTQTYYPSDDAVRIGQEIVKRCCYVPLAIRAIGSLLYGHPLRMWEKWLASQEIGLANIREKENNIMHILKLSYYHLKSPLRSCFSYCAVFPKDFVINKENLISLWMAQGYIVAGSGESLRDVGEGYFLILLRRCFFQDVKKNSYGEIISCKIHDLMHDIAQKVSANEVCEVLSGTANVDKRVRHITLARHEFFIKTFFKARIRTYFQGRICGGIDQKRLRGLLVNCMSLRTLDLSNSNIRTLPESIGKLLHLRCLDLSDNEYLKLLPKSVTKLHNIQTLILSKCFTLEELPCDLSKLLKLSVLDIQDCFKLTYLPSGIGNLTNLHRLDCFMVGRQSSSVRQSFDELEDLKALKKLKGCLIIKVWVPENAKYDKKDDRRGAYLRNKEHLNEVWIKFEVGGCYGTAEFEESLMEDLLPYSDLKLLNLDGYSGRIMPSWGREDKLALFLPNLIRLGLQNCRDLMHLPCLRRLHGLKYLELKKLPNLEYVENDNVTISACGASGSGLCFFPSLEELKLEDLPKLRGWWGPEMRMEPNQSSPCLLLLRKFYMKGCHEMTSIPRCPHLENLEIIGKLQLHMADTDKSLKWEDSGSASPECYLPSASGKGSKTMVLTTYNVEWLKWVPLENFHCLERLQIEGDKVLESLSEVEELFQSCCLSSLRFLHIENCPKLNSVWGGLKHLTALEELVIRNNRDLKINEEEKEGDGIPWKALQQCLRSLSLEYLPKLENLPNGMQYLTSLQYLHILDCENLQSLPEWMQRIDSLKQLKVEKCSTHLKEKWDTFGKDWCNIRHINDIIITEYDLAPTFRFGIGWSS